VLALNPPAIPGLGVTSGFDMQVQQRGGGNVTELVQGGNDLIGAASQDATLGGMRSSVRVTTPQLYTELDREKTKMLGVSLNQVFSTLQAYFGTLYVNDFSEFGRIWRVQMQAEPEYRDEPGDIDAIFVRNDENKMVPLSAVVDQEFRAGPNIVTRKLIGECEREFFREIGSASFECRDDGISQGGEVEVLMSLGAGKGPLDLVASFPM
jgi:multidrug efflux pump subunit AcrB